MTDWLPIIDRIGKHNLDARNAISYSVFASWAVWKRTVDSQQDGWKYDKNALKKSALQARERA